VTGKRFSIYVLRAREFI